MPPTIPLISTSFNYQTLEEKLDIHTHGASLCIGIPKENTLQENRIPLTPDAVRVLVSNGHKVIIEHKAGEGSNFLDKDYSEAGAQISFDKKQVYKSPIIIKSAPVNEEDIDFVEMNQIIISPIQLSAMKASVIEKMMERKVTALSFENFKDKHGTYPIVRSMSEIAGNAVMIIAGHYLSSASHGMGVMLGGISGIPPTKVIILGAGIVGEFAARSALALGATVKVFDNSVYKLKRLQNNLNARIYTSLIDPKVLAKQLKNCDVAVGALSSNSGRTPMVVTKEMVAEMRQGSVIVDVSIDRGGCFETSKITTHEKPVFHAYDVVHYCVPNIPSGFARTASQAISNVLMPLMLKVADDGGFEHYVWRNVNVRTGVYLFKGSLTNYHLSQRFNLKFTDLNLLIASKG